MVKQSTEGACVEMGAEKTEAISTAAQRFFEKKKIFFLQLLGL